MDFTRAKRAIKCGKLAFTIVLMTFFFVVVGHRSYAQIDSRNQIRPDKEKNFVDPDKKTKRIKSKRNPRFTGKKAYSNKKQIKRSRKARAKITERSYKGDITGRKVTTKRTPRRTIARPQPDPYKNRRIRTERSRAGPPVAEPRTATRKGERARTGDISGQSRVRQKSVRTQRRPSYPQPNPYVGRKVRTEKSRAKSNKRQINSIRSATRPSESRKPRSRARPVTATVAPKVKANRHVYRNHERRGGEKSTDKDISGRKIRTKNTRSAGHTTGGRVLSNVNPYIGRPKYKEGGRFKSTRRPPAPRSVTRPPETSRYKENDIYASRKNSRSRKFTGAKKARKVRSLSQPSKKGERSIYGKKYNAGSVRSVSGYSAARRKQSVGGPVTISGNRKSYRQKSTYRGKDRHFGENSSTKDIAGRRLRTKNHRSYHPNYGTIGFMPYYSGGGKKPSKYQPTTPRSVKRGRWNNGGSPIIGKGINANSEAISGFSGRMRSSGTSKYSRGREGAYAGNRKASPRARGGGGSISRSWNNKGKPLIGKGINANSEAISGFRGKRRSSGTSKYSRGREGMYAGSMKASPRSKGGGGSISRSWNNKGRPIIGKGINANSESISSFSGKRRSSGTSKYSRGREGMYAGSMKASPRSKGGGGSISRSWNNKGRPIIGKGINANSEAISGFRGKMRSSGMPKYGRSREGMYAGNIKASPRPRGGGGSISRSWNNKGRPIIGKRINANTEAISRYRGKMSLSAAPSYSKGKEGDYRGKMRAQAKPRVGGGSITRHWNNKGKPIIGRSINANSEALANYRGRMPMSAMPDFSRGKGADYAGKMKRKKPIKGAGGSVTRHWNNKGVALQGRGPTDADENILSFQGHMKARKPLKGAGGSITRHWNNNGRPLEGTGHNGTDEEILVYQGKMRAPDKLEQSEGTERGRTRSLSFIRIGDPMHMGLLKEANNKKVNKDLPKELSRKQRLRLKEADGLDNGRSRSLSFWALGNPTQGGLISNPANARGRLHPSSSYTNVARTRNSVEKKDQPVKIKIWWAKLFKKNANQPDSVKEKPKRPRYDKGERSIWETAEREDWYNN
jgi:hypothetical protein